MQPKYNETVRITVDTKCWQPSDDTRRPVFEGKIDARNTLGEKVELSTELRTAILKEIIKNS